MASAPVLVVGGTRGTGLLIARRLRARGEPVRILARDPVRAASLFDGSVEIIAGDLTKRESLPPAVDGVRHIVFTAGCRSGHPVGEAQVKATEHQGVLDTLSAARAAGFDGRFLYMTSSGVLDSSIATGLLNLWKGNTLVWRRRVEDGIRASGVAYTIIRTGVLLNADGGRRALAVTQRPLPLAPRYRISRADVAEIFDAALDHPDTARVTFEVVWGRGERNGAAGELLRGLVPDAAGSPQRGAS